MAVDDSGCHWVPLEPAAARPPARPPARLSLAAAWLPLWLPWADPSEPAGLRGLCSPASSLPLLSCLSWPGGAFAFLGLQTVFSGAGTTSTPAGPRPWHWHWPLAHTCGCPSGSGCPDRERCGRAGRAFLACRGLRRPERLGTPSPRPPLPQGTHAVPPAGRLPLSRLGA